MTHDEVHQQVREIHSLIRRLSAHSHDLTPAQNRALYDALYGKSEALIQATLPIESLRVMGSSLLVIDACAECLALVGWMDDLVSAGTRQTLLTEMLRASTRLMAKLNPKEEE